MENSKYIHLTNVHNTLAAEEMVPVLIEWFHPKSVVDVGCGLGTWLYVFNSHGVKEILGIEGHHLNKDMLVISEDNVMLANLEEEFRITKKFDLALSLEVAEHLSESVSDRFIESLTMLSDVIVFSAAIPNQGGQNHINEQWIGYWQSRFEKHDFILTDEIRPLFWRNEKIEWWYKQNMVVAIKKGTQTPFRHIKPPLDLVHPLLFASKNKVIKYLKENENEKSLSIATLINENERIENENRQLKIRSFAAELELKKIHNSVTWRLASKFIIAPISILIKIFKRISIF